MRPSTLALDVEGTLISNAISQIPRPGLLRFLSYVEKRFERLVVFSSVPEPLFREIADLLVAEGHAPPWFRSVQYVNWHGRTKDLRFVSDDVGDALLLDDYGAYVHPGQEHLWIKIPQFCAPYEESDVGLVAALESISQHLSINGST
ncbi:hypothetical protein GUL16_12820 [Stenotrophomonas maltophilia]|nr:hypothetical protein [Stenotrophomonas maltophilia]